LCLLSTSCTGSGKGAPENGNGAEKVLKDTVKSDSVLSEMALAIERQVVLERVKCIYGLIKEETTYLGGNVDNDCSYTPVRVELVYEDGQWKIDNFHHLKYMLNLRESMYQYLDHDLAYLI